MDQLAQQLTRFERVRRKPAPRSIGQVRQARPVRFDVFPVLAVSWIDELPSGRRRTI